MEISDDQAESETIPKKHSSVRQSKRICGLTLKTSVSLIGSLVVPLLLAIFTAVITFEQRNENQIQREEDLRAAHEQREQDLNNFALQRELDHNISVMQRAHDKEIAQAKQSTDDVNAEKQRNMSQIQREHELAVQKERYDRERAQYLDQLILSYINDIALLLDKNGGSLISNPTTAAIARAKSFNVISQLDPQRKIQLILFLYDTGQLQENDELDRLDLWSAHLDGINWSKRTRSLPINDMNLMGTYLNNASFAGQQMSNCNFDRCHLRDANFTRTSLYEINFEYAILINATFSFSSSDKLKFVYTDLREAIFYQAVMTEINALTSQFRKVDFRNTR